MKSHLSYILPVHEACEILGEPCVRRIVQSYLSLKQQQESSGYNNNNYNNNDASNRQHSSSMMVDPKEELQLVKALFYPYTTPPHDDGRNNANETMEIPSSSSSTTVRSTQSRYTKRSSGLDKRTFWQFTLPPAFLPKSGPHGHLGLFDCWVYALSGNANNTAATTNYTSSTTTTMQLTPVVLLPDLLIVLAICKEYSQNKNNNNNATTKEEEGEKKKKKQSSTDSEENNKTKKDDEDDNPHHQDSDNNNNYALMMLSVLAFRIYDSYQKKGILVRDTLHRFMSDIYGEDSYKTPHVRHVLNDMFRNQNESSSRGTTTTTTSTLRTSLTASQFCRAIQATATTNNNNSNKKHILLDWIATLATHMLYGVVFTSDTSSSLSVSLLPPSTMAYLETMELRHKSMDKLCQQYKLHSQLLYETKRKFHSLVESSNHATAMIIQGDPMGNVVEEEVVVAVPEQQTQSSKQQHKRLQVISKEAFLQAVCHANEEMGHGGYLPESLAIWIFQGGADTTSGSSMEEEENMGDGGWSLYDVLNFCFQAVRSPQPNISQQSAGSPSGRESSPASSSSSEDEALLHFCFGVFGMLPGGTGHKVLTRPQVARMLLLLLAHAAFRLKADSPPQDDLEDNDDLPEKHVADTNTMEDKRIDVTSASLLGVLPPNVEDTHVCLRELVDHVLNGQEHLTFSGFCEWHHRRVDADLPQRLGPLLLELRLIASVLFGIPPTRASLEYSLVSELNRRHKYRYPQTDTARRGPRGTVWYIIEDGWYKKWLACIQQVAGTDKDAMDGREVPHQAPRGLRTIRNAPLLADNGSLALRSDIRWRHDYEIVPPLAWAALQAWYDGGPPIHRMVVPYIPTTGAPSPHSRSPRVRTEYEIELYPYFVTVFMCDASSRGEARPFQQYVPLSRVCPIRILLVQLCKGLEIDPKYGRLWVMDNGQDTEGNPNDWLLNLDENIVVQRQSRGYGGDQGSGNSIRLLLELKDEETGQWPRGLDGKNWTFREPGAPESDSDVGDGIVGLYNMGNTCYLNSSIQCLSHTPVFRDYFTSKAYLNDINTTNPIGHQGRLAQVVATLINALWKNQNQQHPHQPKRVTAPGSYAPVACPALTPKTFRDSLGKFNDHFAGNEQHDAQELLAFLLGGLSEDLNRIVEKPYIEAPDSDGRPDSELAEIWWSNHLKREMSIIVAMFTGQYKSLLTCRSCKYESARFEPFSFLQLPLPEDDHISVSLIFYQLKEGLEPTKYSVRVRHDGKLLDVLLALAKLVLEDEVEVAGNGHHSPSKNDDEGEDGVDSAMQEQLQEMAKNMAVVDMRDGYIFKIAPNSWALPDLQNKETGELPSLHVYELDPLPSDSIAMASSDAEKTTKKAKQNGPSATETGKEATDGKTEEDNSSSSSSSSSSDIENEEFKRVESDDGMSSEIRSGERHSTVKYSYLALAQRRTELISREMLHPFNQHVFATPLLLRVVDLEGYSGRDLYDLVAKRLKNFVPKSALRFLAGDRDEPVEASTDGDDSEEDGFSLKPRAGTRQRRRQTTSEMEEVAAGPVPRYGFRLRLASRDGRRCALCPWYECCIGCLIPDDDYPTIAMCGDSIVLDWHFAVDIATAGFGCRLNLDLTGPQSSLRARMPPPLPVKNHKSCGDQAKKGNAGSITLEDCLDAFAKEERIPEAYCSSCKDFRVQTKRMSLWRLPPVVIIHLKRFQFTQHMRRKLRELVIFPVEGLDLSRIVAGDSKLTQQNVKMMSGETPREAESEDETTADEQEDVSTSSRFSVSSHSGRSEMLYDLYGVVHHQGALSGGHYVASLKSEIDGQWRLFNDAQVYEIHSRDVVDPSAYILFYIRRDVKDAKLQDFWDIVGREGEGLTEEDMEKLMKGRSDRCVIS